MNEQDSQSSGTPADGHVAKATGPVLLCFDGSDNASQAISAAGTLMVGREAIVLSVWEPVASLTSLNPLGEVVGEVTGIYREMDEVGAQLAKRQADEGVAVAGRAGFDAEPLTALGKPWVEILRVAEERDVAAIVLGGGGLARLSSIVLGSVSARVLHSCPRPVLVIPAGDAASGRERTPDQAGND
jgi:nucleotide-binding universal stress UspA family protein